MVPRISPIVLRNLIVPMLLLAAVGCSKSPYEFLPVHGSVTIDGQAMSGGRVMFAPVAKAGGTDAGQRAFGAIQPDGGFVLGTVSDDDGAVVGTHWITVFAPSQDNSQPALNRTSNSPAAAPGFSRITVPSGAVEVLAGQDNEVNVHLTSQDIAKFGQK